MKKVLVIVVLFAGLVSAAMASLNYVAKAEAKTKSDAAYLQIIKNFEQSTTDVMSCVEKIEADWFAATTCAPVIENTATVLKANKGLGVIHAKYFDKQQQESLLITASDYTKMLDNANSRIRRVHAKQQELLEMLGYFR